MRTRRLVRAVPLVVLAVVVVLALVLLVAGGGDARYVTRVLVHGSSDVGDAEWKPRVTVLPTRPMPWPGDGRDCRGAALPTKNAQSVVVVHDGALTCSWYGNGGAPDRPAAAFSVSKTVLSLLIARAVADGTLPGLDLPLTRAVPELAARDPRFGAITLAELLDMRSGIAFSPYVPFPFVDQDQPAVYYATDLARTVVEKPVVDGPPGTFTYNDYGPNLVGLVFRRTTGDLITGAPLSRLWADLGAQDPVGWSVDDQGFPYHESGLVVSARDLARVGQLVLDGGAPAFSARSLDPVGQVPVEDFQGTPLGYRNGWWVLPRPDGGHDLAAMGDHGQILVVSPTTRTVAVRMGDDDPINIAIAHDLQAVADRVAGG